MATPTEGDIGAVQDTLAELYATLSPAQQDVLDTIIAAGLSLADEEDSGGYVMAPSQLELESYMRDRVASLREDYRRANDSAEEQPGEARGPRGPRWNLRPLLDWVGRPTPRPA